MHPIAWQFYSEEVTSRIHSRKLGAPGKKESDESVGGILGNLASALSEGVYWLEDTVDNLLSIGLMGDWRFMREKFPEKSEF